MIQAGLLKRLDEVEKKYLEIEKCLSDPGLTPSEIHRFSKERSELGELVEIQTNVERNRGEQSFNF